MHFRRVAVFVAMWLLFGSTVTASTNVPLDDDAYDLLVRLEAEDVIRSGLLTTRPLSRNEVARLVKEAELNSQGKSPLIKKMVDILKEKFKKDIDGAAYVRPLDVEYLGYIYSDQDGELDYNLDGDSFEKGSNLRVGVSSRAELKWLSLFFNPELRASEDDSELVIKRAYGTLEFLGLAAEAGKDSQWWGPGYHGALLLSTNAEPLTMLKVSNPEAARLPWIFRHLGYFRFAGFVSRLEEDRVVPEPYLWGLRLNLKPSRYVDLGLQRTAMLGGEGRPAGLSTWWDSFTARGENSSDGLDEPGDQRAGGDIKITLPFDFQPVQLYGEIEGEDEAGGLPSEYAFVAGVYLPGIFTVERLGLRAEYARTSDEWYVHHIYQSGYTYKGRIIGHHVGRDSDDLFLELSCLLPEIKGGVKVSYDRERNNLSGGQSPTKDEIALEAKYGFKGLGAKGRLAAARLEDEAGGSENAGFFMIALDYAF